jgi:hypothetical protein
MKKKQFLIDIICFVFTSLFMYTAISKIGEISTFKETLNDIPLLNKIQSLVAYLVIVSELILAILLQFPRFQLQALYGCFVTVFIFTLYIVYIIVFVKNLPCHCGGAIEKMSWRQHFYFNLTLLAMAFVAIWLFDRQKGQTHLLQQNGL